MVERAAVYFVDLLGETKNEVLITIQLFYDPMAMRTTGRPPILTSISTTYPSQALANTRRIYSMLLLPETIPNVNDVTPRRESGSRASLMAFPASWHFLLASQATQCTNLQQTYLHSFLIYGVFDPMLATKCQGHYPVSAFPYH